MTQVQQVQEVVAKLQARSALAIGDGVDVAIALRKRRGPVPSDAPMGGAVALSVKPSRE